MLSRLIPWKKKKKGKPVSGVYPVGFPFDSVGLAGGIIRPVCYAHPGR